MAKEFKDIFASTAGLNVDEKIRVLRKTLGLRLDEALKIVQQDKVRKYLFKPSGKTVWIVEGKEGIYEVLPEAPYCSCDDFYFRVLNGKTQLCYHLIAQGLAEATDRYLTVERDDSDYDEFISIFRRSRRLGKPRIYVKYREDVRNFVESIIASRPMRIREIYREILTAGFEIPNPKSLANFLANDPKGRFICEKGLWKLRA
ncbi:hypothetical protein KEJ27_01905 [Candidatus Bathyarchaeota archaeon]|nr:hypothetical protein [Candidatus Bathyarchaeota archaeon]MBS7612910.1 hypothetical protein [Candidatus Bathyarchaeota archaeon]MBS7617802.1 hypothetical protein [Candidatus Bathyarchaeota archaeon]